MVNVHRLAAQCENALWDGQMFNTGAQQETCDTIERGLAPD